MSKAVLGAVEIAGAVGMGALMLVQPELVANPLYLKAMFALGIQGIATEAGAIADALSSNRSNGVTIRQPAAYRQIIYGTQRVGGTIVYVSSTGSKNDQYNLVIAVAGHVIEAIENLYIDGRRVYWAGQGPDYIVRSGIGFGGGADGQNHTGPNGVTYNFANASSGHAGLYAVPYFGDQADGTVCGSLQANDPTWTGTSGQTPYLGGTAYVYLKLEDGDTNAFPQMPPEIKFTVRGKRVFDPRTGQIAFSSNPALILADVLTDPRYGLGDQTVNQAQLIAAANICDEQVPCAQGTEARYSCHHHYDTSTSIGDVLQVVLNSMAGRLSRISGEWYIFPGAYLAPSLHFTAGDLKGPVQWEPKRAYRELFNRVRGTYTAANYPYNVAGNLYDSNGFYQGQIQNNWTYEFQSDNYPEVACDTLHGYPADEYLTEDGGHLLVRELGLPAVLSVAQAQRLGFIELRRNRQQGSGKLVMSLAALQLQPCDTFTLDCPAQGWLGKLLEVTSIELSMMGGDGQSAPQFVVHVGVQETDPSVYAHATAEELSPYQVPAVPSQAPLTPTAPSNMTVTSLVFTQPDGTLTRSLEVQWDTPEDNRVTTIQVQYQMAGSTTWWDGGTVSVLSNAMLLSSIVAGQTYNVRIASVYANGAISEWIEADGVATTSLSPVVYQGQGIDPGALTVTGSTVNIASINAALGNTQVSYYSGGAAVALPANTTQGQQVYIYTVDPEFSGGNPTPIATTNRSDYLGRQGYVLLGAVAA